MEMAAKSRIRWIDIAKGLCILSVILGHMSSKTFAFTFAYHLPVFFILSGYTLKKKAVTKEYLKSKFSSLMTPYFLTCLGVVIIDIITALVQGKSTAEGITRIIYTDLVRSFFASGTIRTLGSIDMGPIIGAIWFLPAMFFAVLFTQLILNRVQRKRDQAIVGVIACILACIAAEIIWLPFSILSAIQAIPLMLVGMWLREKQILDKIRPWQYALCALLFLGVFSTRYAQRFYMVTCHIEDWLFTPGIVIIASFLVLGLSKLIEKVKYFKFFEAVGRNSLVVLCIHKLEGASVYPLMRILLPIDRWNYVLVFVARIVLILIVAWLIEKGRKKTKEKVLCQRQSKDCDIHILCAGLITLLLIGQVPAVDSGLKKWLYGFHMLSFVMVKGYFYKPIEKASEIAGRYLKLLVPYVVFAAAYVALAKEQWNQALVTVGMGISHTKNLFTNISSVGPIYFLPMMFCVWVLYDGILWLAKKEGKEKAPSLTYIFLFVLAMVGVWLGRWGLWLPWSADVALFALLLFHIGQQMGEHGALKWCADRPYLYFALACGWAFMTNQGSKGLSANRYGYNIGIAVLGAVCAFLTLYLLSRYFVEHLPKWVTVAQQTIGRSAGHILVIHGLFREDIANFVTVQLGCPSRDVSYVLLVVVIQLLLGTCSYLLIWLIKSVLTGRKKLPADT